MDTALMTKTVINPPSDCDEPSPARPPLTGKIGSRPSVSGSSGAGATLGRPADSAPILPPTVSMVVDSRYPKEQVAEIDERKGWAKGTDMDKRRVVTGHNAEGKAVFVSDEAVAPVTLALLPGYEFHLLWGADSTVTFPDDGERPASKGYFPPIGGFRFGIFTIPPDGGAGPPADLEIEAAHAEFREKLPGLSERLEPDNPGMHTSSTIDYGIVLSGEATLELDDGSKLSLGAGDTYVQNGTRHRWSNRGAVPAVIAVTLVGADHRNLD